MSGFTTTEATSLLGAALGVSTYTAPTAPEKLRVETVAGTAAAAGTELGSTTWPSITWGSVSGTPPQGSNSAPVTVVAGAAGTVVAAAVWDNAGTPRRILWGALAASRPVQIGDSLAFGNGSLVAQQTS